MYFASTLEWHRLHRCPFVRGAEKYGHEDPVSRQGQTGRADVANVVFEWMLAFAIIVHADRMELCVVWDGGDIAWMADEIIVLQGSRRLNGLNIPDLFVTRDISSLFLALRISLSLCIFSIIPFLCLHFFRFLLFRQFAQHLFRSSHPLWFQSCKNIAVFIFRKLSHTNNVASEVPDAFVI